MKKIFLILFFVPMVCFAEFEYLDEPSKVTEESGPWEEYANDKKEITPEDIYKATQEYVENIPDESKDKLGIIKKDELIALINELSLKLELVRNSNGDKSSSSHKETFKLIKKYPYSSVCNQKLIVFCNTASLISTNSPHEDDILYILEKLTKHSLRLSEAYDAAIYFHIKNGNKLTKK